MWYALFQVLFDKESGNYISVNFEHLPNDFGIRLCGAMGFFFVFRVTFFEVASSYLQK